MQTTTTSATASRNITRKSASNLALAFVLLPKAKRDAMSALYAFCREVDDVADEESVPTEDRRAALDAWRQDIRKACEQGAPSQIVNRELQPFIEQYQLSFELFNELILGVEMDLDIKSYATHEELEHYCYRVASVVGLLSIPIFGFKDPACKNYAIYLGKALQLTNILRDVKTDAERGRIYLPQAELNRFGVTADEIFKGVYSDRYERLAASVAQRARQFYQLARTTLPAADRRSMITAELMGSVYWQLLLKLEARRFNVFGSRSVRLTKARKISLILAAWWRHVSGSTEAPYGTV